MRPRRDEPDEIDASFAAAVILLFIAGLLFVRTVYG